MAKLDPDERDEVGIADPMGRIQKTLIISEAGLYNLSKRGNKPGVSILGRSVLGASPVPCTPRMQETIHGVLEGPYAVTCSTRIDIDS
jgi:hypothetical protein